MKVLLAIDGSTCSDAAIEEVARRPWPKDTELKIITAVEIPIMVAAEPWAASADYFEEMELSVRQAAKAVIDAALGKLGKITQTVKLTTEIIQGPPRQVIVDEAERWNADLIVMGSRGLGAWNRLLLGSVSNAVVHHAKCSVEIVRQRYAA
jgi:nucleotide-binding universal stress UspA family protein